MPSAIPEQTRSLSGLRREEKGCSFLRRFEHVYVYACISGVCLCLRACVYVCMCVYACVCAFMCTYVSVSVCVCVWGAFWKAVSGSSQAFRFNIRVPFGLLSSWELPGIL